MEVKMHPFRDLSVPELYEIYRLRSEVFVVEQNCAYNDVDELDPKSIHFWLEEDGRILSYLRLIPCDPDVHIGRVLSTHRHKGYATMLLKDVLAYCQKASFRKVELSAQVYAKELYEKLGFTVCGEPYLLDGIPHVDMSIEL